MNEQFNRGRISLECELISNVLIDGYYGFRNLGDECILHAVLRDVRDLFPRARITVLSYDPDETVRLHSGISTINRLNFDRVKSAINGSDLVILGGGGLFHEHYRLRLRDVVMYNYYASTVLLAGAYGKPLYFYGLGLGPFFTEEGFAVARLIVKVADGMAVRDEYSRNLAMTLGGHNIRVAADPVFLLQPTNGPARENSRSLLLSLREWVDQGLEKRLIEEIARSLVSLLERRFIDKVLFLPFQMWATAEHDDRKLFRRLVEALPERFRNRIEQSEISGPQEMLDTIAKGSVMVGERLHSVILSAVAGVPFVALGYDRKVENVCRDLGMSDFCLDIHNGFSEEMVCRIEEIDHDRALVKERLEKGLSSLRERARLNKEYLRKFVEEYPSGVIQADGHTARFEDEIIVDLKRKIEKLWNRTEEMDKNEKEISQQLTNKGEELKEAGREIDRLKDVETAYTRMQEDIALARSRLAILDAALVERQGELDHIRNSQGWKALLLLYRIRDGLFPMDSVRRSTAKRVFRAGLTVLRQLRHLFRGGRGPVATTETLPVVEETPVLTDKGVPNLRAIAFYLPQFHPIPENDEWWGKGFTEWTNVAKARTLFEGHYQPHVPGELGYYDLRSSVARLAQASLAREHGIHGFCYYHYWFNGRLLLNEPLDAVLSEGKPVFPFCLCWANEDWTRAWDGRSGEVLIGQAYNHEDDREHMRYLAPIFADERYIRVGGRPLFLVYRANRMPDPKKTADIWREEARSLGIGEIYLCRVESFPDEHADPGEIGFDASVEFQPDWTQLGNKLSLDIDHSVYDYGDIAGRMLAKPPVPYKRFPCVTPSWDNSPRRERDSVILRGSTPGLYGEWLHGTIEKLKSANEKENLVFINAWNEWGEGNHLEPDALNGRAYLETTKHVLEGYGAPAAAYERLCFPECDRPLVSIIVPVHNQFAYTYRCLSSILAHCKQIEYEVIVADDLSSDETADIINFAENIKVVRNNENLGFLKNCNKAAKQASGEYLVLVNNDTSVKEGWLAHLVDLMNSDERIGIVGSKLIFADGRLQEAGGIIWTDGSGCNYGRLDDPEKPEYNYVKEVDYVSGCSLMVRRSLWNEIDGFDEAFSPAYYEDTDLAFEIRKRDYKVMYQPKSAIVHFEGASHGTDINNGIKKFQVVNQEKFVGKWKTTLDRLHHMSGDGRDMFYARDRSRDRKMMLFIDNSVPDYDKHAGSRTIFQYLKLFARMGFNVKFIDNNCIQYGVKYEPYTSILEQMGIEVFYGEWYRDNWKKWVKEHGPLIDYVYLHKVHPSIDYIDFVKSHTKARIIYNCADFHYLRELRQYKVEKDKAQLKKAREIKKTEFYLFGKSDTVLTYSDHEKFILSKKLPAKDVHVMPIFFYDESFPLGAGRGFEERKDILFVGGFAHIPNVDAMIWFVRHVYSLIRRKIPDVVLNIVGSNPPETILKLRADGVNITGFVSDEELARYYETSRVVVAPIRFGAGVKGKIIEAVAYGVPVVSTTTGMEGIRDADGTALVADREDLFARSVIELHEDRRQWNALHDRQVEYANKYLGFDYAEQFVRAALGEGHKRA